MKSHYFIVPIALVFAACATPEERAREDALHRQEKLRNEARKRFEEERDRDRQRQEDLEKARREAQEDARDHAEEMAKDRAEAAKKDAEYQTYLHEYARALGKTPAQLSPDERKRIRDKFY